MDNGKKEYPENGDEVDVTYARDIYCYIQNGKSVAKNVKRKMNKRFRRRKKLEIKQAWLHTDSHYQA